MDHLPPAHPVPSNLLSHHPSARPPSLQPWILCHLLFFLMPGIFNISLLYEKWTKAKHFQTINAKLKKNTEATPSQSLLLQFTHAVTTLHYYISAWNILDSSEALMSALWSWIHNSMFNHKVQPVVFKPIRCPRCWHQTKEGLISENSFWRSANYKWIWRCTDSIYSAENKLGPLRSSLWSWIHFNMFKSNHKLLDLFMVLSPYYGHPNTCMSGSLLHSVGGFCGSDITVTTWKLSNAGPCGALRGPESSTWKLDWSYHLQIFSVGPFRSFCGTEALSVWSCPFFLTTPWLLPLC